MGHFDNITIRALTGETATSTAGTIYQDLPEKGQLSALLVDYAAASQHSTNPALLIWDEVTKIEVLVDGSKVVKAYDGKQCRALAHYWGMDLAQLGFYNREGTSGDKTFWKFPILFGRYIGDTEYMLDMEQYSNPQLRITYDASQTSVAGETYNAYATPTVRTGVEGIIWRGGAPPEMKGYIKSTEIDNWSCVASTTRQTELPRGQNVLGYMQGARYIDDQMVFYIESTELTFDNGEWQLLDHTWRQLCSLDAAWFPRPVEIRIRKDFLEADYFDTGMGVCNDFSADQSNPSYLRPNLSHEGTWNIQALYCRTVANAACAMHAGNFHLSGQFPHQYMYVPMYKYAEHGEFGIDTTKYGRIDIKTTTGAGANTSADLQTVAEYVIPNGE